MSEVDNRPFKDNPRYQQFFRAYCREYRHKPTKPYVTVDELKVGKTRLYSVYVMWVPRRTEKHEVLDYDSAHYWSLGPAVAEGKRLAKDLGIEFKYRAH